MGHAQLARLAPTRRAFIIALLYVFIGVGFIAPPFAGETEPPTPTPCGERIYVGGWELGTWYVIPCD